MTDPRPTRVDLLWGERRRPAKGPRPSLSVERIVAEAIAVADGEGLAALTMPGLAKRLGVGTMSLYRYVPGKDELIGLMIETAIGTAPDLAGTDGWRAAVSTWARAMRAIFLRHPWLLDLVVAPRTMGPRELVWLELGLRSVAELPLPPMVRFDLSLLVNGFVRGAALETTQEERPDWRPPFSPQLLAEYGRTADFPLLMEVMSVFPAEHSAAGEDARFEFGLTRLLDGIEMYVDAAAV